jgi:hypothetical protein
MALTVNDQSSASRFFRRIIPRILAVCLALFFCGFSVVSDSRAFF